MRVTTNMMVSAITSNIFKQSQRLLDAQTKVSTEKDVNSISDDPTAMSKILKYRSKLSSIEQYSDNITKGKTWIELTETTLESIESQLDEVIELAEECVSGSYEDRESAVEMVKAYYDQIMEMANSQSGDGRYIFSGHQTSTAPFSRNDDYEAEYHGDNGDIKIITGEKSTTTINVTGDVLFTEGGVNVFDVMEGLISGLENPDTAAGDEQISEQIENLNSISDQIRNKASEISVTYQSLELTENRLSILENNIEDLLSGIEDVDLNEAVIELQTLQTSYETTLEVAAMITSQKSLIDFL